MAGIRRLVARHGVWLLASLVVAVIVAAITGYWLLVIAYGVMNSAGTVLYVDALPPRSRKRRRLERVFPALTVAQLPVGIFGVFATKGDTPMDAVLGDEEIRTQTAASNAYGDRRHGSGF